MKSGRFDATRFYAALDAQRCARELTWKQVAAESEVSASTLTRLAQGRRPDVDGLLALCAWSGLKAESFAIEGSALPRETETLTMISTHLRADRNLSAADAEMLQELIQVAYERLRKRKD